MAKYIDKKTWRIYNNSKKTRKLGNIKIRGVSRGMEVSGMKKDEILELSKKENVEGDEREKKVKSRGQFIAMNVMYILAIIILLLNHYFGRIYTFVSVLGDILLISFSVSLVYDLYWYMKERDKVYLYYMVGNLLLVIWEAYDFIKDLIH